MNYQLFILKNGEQTEKKPIENKEVSFEKKNPPENKEIVLINPIIEKKENPKSSSNNIV